MMASDETPPEQQPTSTQYREYRPDSRFETSYVEAAKALFSEAIRFRSHIATIFVQQFRNSYQGTKLGVFWNFILPLLPISVYVMLATFRVFPSFEGIPAALAIAFSATIWFLFSSCISTPISVVRNRNAEAMKTSLPLSSSVIASFAQTVFELMVRGLAVVAIAAAVLQPPSWTIPLALLVVLAGVTLFFGLGLLLAILNIVYSDIQRVVSVVLMYGIFLSGVIFPLSHINEIAWLEWANPFAAFIKASRELAFTGALTEAMPLIIWSVVGLVAALVGLRTFYVMEKRIRGVI